MEISKVKVISQSSKSQDEECSFLTMDAVDLLKSESKVGKTSYSAVRKNAGGNETEPFSMWSAVPSAVALVGY